MGTYVVSQLVKAMTKRGITVSGARVLIMGLAFKENCPDIRNTRVVDIVAELKDHNCNVDIYDPWVSEQDAKHEYGLTMIAELKQGQYDAIVISVAHQQFKEMGQAEIRALGKAVNILYDLKYLFKADESDLRL